MKNLAVRAIISFAAFASLALVGDPCLAVPLVFNYSGNVHSITLIQGETDTLGLSVGSNVTGSFFFDSDSVDTDSSNTRGFYEDSILRMRFDGVQSTPLNIDFSSFLVDADPATDHIAAFLEAVNGSIIDVFTFSLEAPDVRAVLGSDTPDWSALSLSDFDLSDSRFEFLRATFLPDGTVPRTHISARLTSLRITVPEPSALSLVGLALGGLIALRQRRNALSASPWNFRSRMESRR